MTEPNMTLQQLNRWTQTEAFREYKRHRGAGKVNAVIERTKRYLRGTATPQEQQKVESFISRMKADEAGARDFGSGSSAVSARTASLRNWGYDPTGRYA